MRLAFTLGFTSIVSQILLLRELVTVFYGNETAYAVILGSWLFWIGAGSYSVSLLARRIRNPRLGTAVFLWLISLIIPSSVIASRGIKHILGVHAGEIIGIMPMCVSSFLLLAPLTFLLGGLFTLICLLKDRQSAAEGAFPVDTKGVGTIYLWESAGAAAGGLVFSFFLIHLLPALSIAFVIGMMNIAGVVFLYPRPSGVFKAGIVLIIAILLAFLFGLVHRLDEAVRRMQWEGFEVVASADSIYGNIVMTKTGETYSLYENGLHAYTTRDDLTSEAAVHYPLLEHPQPKDVLLIGNGVAGGVREILKYPQVRVDYIELDPAVIDISRRHLPSEYGKVLDDSRVHVIYGDGRWHVKRTSQKYDAVIVNLPDPYTALINRYYSVEFFREVRRLLHPQGILSLSVSSSENYLNEEAQTFLRSIHTSLREVFVDVKSIPGETNVFLACGQAGLLTYDANILARRLQERGVQTQYIREYYLPYQLSEDRIAYIEEVLSKKGIRNTDTHPIAYLYDIILWSTHFHTGFKDFFKKIEGIRFSHLMILPLALGVLGWARRRFSPVSAVTLSIMTTGFSEIIFQLVVILAFQSLYGYAYYKIGLIMASFMGGLVLGSLAAKTFVKRPRDSLFKVYRITQLAICLYPLLLPLVFIIFREAPVAQRFVGAFATTFAMLPAVAGFIGGLQYPLAAELIYSYRHQETRETAQPAGFLYAVDVLGAAIGALVTGMFLVPLLGIYAVAFFCAVLNGVVFLLLYPAQSSVGA